MTSSIEELHFLPERFDCIYQQKGESLEDFDSVKDMIIIAYNNSKDHPDEAIQNLLSAILEIQDLETRRKMKC